MAGGKVANKEVEQEIPPHAAGREVLSYVEQQEKEADEAFAEAHGVDPEGEADDKKNKQEAEDKADDKEADGEEPDNKELEAKDKTADDDGDLTKGLSTENATKRISAAQNKMHDSNARAKTAEEQVAKLAEERDALLKRLEEKPTASAAKAEEPGKEAEKQSNVKAEPDELQKSLDELAEEYPEIAKPMLKMMARQEVENKKLTDQVATLVENEQVRVADAKTEKTNTHITAISEVHKDYAEIAEDPLLDEWIDGLPEMEKAGAQAIRSGGSTKAVIDMLTRFKEANGYELPADTSKDTPEKKGNSKLDKAKKAANPSFNKSKDVNLKEGLVGKFTAKGIGRMTQEEYNAVEPEIDEWMAAGSPE